MSSGRTIYRPLVLLAFAVLFFAAASGSKVMAANPPFVRGNANLDQAVDIADPIYTLRYLFISGQAPSCLDHADANDDGNVNIADPTTTLSTLYLGQNSIQPPYPEAGHDLSFDSHTCGDLPPIGDPADEGIELPSSPILHIVVLIKLLTPEQMEIIGWIDSQLHAWFTAIRALDLENPEDLQTLLDILTEMFDYGYGSDSFLASLGLPAWLVGTLAEAINAAPTTTAEQLQTTQQQETAQAVDKLNSAGPGLHKITSGGGNPDDDYFCYTCVSPSTEGGGLKISVTIYFLARDKVHEAEIPLINKLAAQANAADNKCCKQYVYVYIPEMKKTIRDNAKDLIGKIKGDLQRQFSGTAQGDSEDNCVVAFQYNLIGWSAGGIQAFQTAVEMGNQSMCEINAPGRECCDEEMPDKIKVGIKLVTIDSPFDAANVCVGIDQIANAGAWIGEMCGGLFGCKTTYLCSVGAENYGGNKPPCLCSFTAYGNDSTAGTGSHLEGEGWNVDSRDLQTTDHVKAIEEASSSADFQFGCDCGTPAAGQ